MIGVVLGVLGVVFGGALIARWLLDADPRVLAKTIKISGLLLGAVLVIALIASRNLGAALVLASFLLPMVMNWRVRARRAKAARGPTANQESSIRTAWLDVSLSHDTGEVYGQVTAGPYAGRRFETLSLEELVRLAQDCARADPQSQVIVEAYLDRRFGFEWREEATASGAGDGGSEKASRAARPMDQAEALTVLGLGRDATPDQIKAAYHRLMKRHHPDQGGSAELAARLNAARDVLLGDR